MAGNNEFGDGGEGGSGSSCTCGNACDESKESFAAASVDDGGCDADSIMSGRVGSDGLGGAMGGAV